MSNRHTAPGTHVAAFHFTIALLPGGPSLITHPPVWYKAEKIKTTNEVDDEALKELLTKPLRESKKTKKAKKKEEEGEEWDFISVYELKKRQGAWSGFER